MASCPAMGRPPVGGADWSFSSRGGVWCVFSSLCRCSPASSNPGGSSHNPPKHVHASGVALEGCRAYLKAGGATLAGSSRGSRTRARRRFGEILVKRYSLNAVGPERGEAVCSVRNFSALKSMPRFLISFRSNVFWVASGNAGCRPLARIGLNVLFLKRPLSACHN